MTSIPNLLSLRGARGGGGGGRRGGRVSRRGVGVDGHGASSSSSSADADIQATDTDAAISRLSAVQAGYLDDPFAELFVSGPAARRFPIINRGTYARTTALDRLVARFLTHSDASKTRQIISLGAGTDTRSLRLFSSSTPSGANTAAAPPPPATNLVYHELDFPDICARKLRTVQSTPALRSVLANPNPTTEGGSSWTAQPAPSGTRYFCHGIDLRALDDVPGLVPDAPTLLVSECCLCYLPTAAADAVLAFFAERIAPGAGLGVVLYEPIRAHDAFGKVMVANLAARRIRMPTVLAYQEPRDQVARLRGAGFDRGGGCVTVDEVWRGWVGERERARVDGLEGLDEVEEWELLAGHYAVAWAWRGEDGFGGWEEGDGGGGADTPTG